MANVKVRLKDASQNVLHPETEWSLVQGKPSFTIGQNSSGQRSETWSAPITTVAGENLIGLVSSKGGIMINDSVVKKNTPLADYPINYSAISGKPSYLVDKERMVFGHYSTVRIDPEGQRYTGTVYPAIRKYEYDDNHGQGATYTYTCYYFNGTSWVALDNSKFTPSL